MSFVCRLYDTEQGRIFFKARILKYIEEKQENNITKNEIFITVFLCTKPVNSGGNCNYYQQLHNHYYLKLQTWKGCGLITEVTVKMTEDISKAFQNLSITMETVNPLMPGDKKKVTHTQTNLLI